VHFSSVPAGWLASKIRGRKPNNLSRFTVGALKTRRENLIRRHPFTYRGKKPSVGMKSVARQNGKKFARARVRKKINDFQIRLVGKILLESFVDAPTNFQSPFSPLLMRCLRLVKFGATLTEKQGHR